MEGVRKRREGLWTEMRGQKAWMVDKGARTWVVMVSDHWNGCRSAIEAIEGGDAAAAGRMTREASRSFCMCGGFVRDKYSLNLSRVSIIEEG